MINKANIFMTAGWVGVTGLACTVICVLLDAPDILGVTAFYLSIASCWAALFTRNADEYTQGLWTSAASFAFASLLIMIIALPALEGFYDGLTGSQRGQDTEALHVVVLAVIAFYCGLFWRRLRGSK